MDAIALSVNTSGANVAWCLQVYPLSAPDWHQHRHCAMLSFAPLTFRLLCLFLMFSRTTQMERSRECHRGNQGDRTVSPGNWPQRLVSARIGCMGLVRVSILYFYKLKRKARKRKARRKPSKVYSQYTTVTSERHDRISSLAPSFALF